MIPITYGFLSLEVVMKVFRTSLYIVCSLCVSCAFLVSFFDSNRDKTALLDKLSTVQNECAGTGYDKCIAKRDNALEKRDFETAFEYLRKLCDGGKDSKSCNLIYSTYFEMAGNQDSSESSQKISLYEVLYYLDVGCKLNDYDSCLKAARIYEYGEKPGAEHSSHGYNIAYDAQEAKKYYKRVCESISDSAIEACSHVVDLSTRNNKSYEASLAELFSGSKKKIN